MPRLTRTALSFTTAGALTTTVGAQAAQPPRAPAPIEDNSFLIEEAYNQEFGVVQHISTFARTFGTRGWAYTFTQEWPVPGQTHQLSYTAAVVRPSSPDASTRFGDLLLNYRYQALDRHGVLLAPRLSVLVPTGSAANETGVGGAGIQVNVPLTLELAPRWVAHTNVGGTLVPHAKTETGDRHRLTNQTIGQSVIFLPLPTLNFMLEAVYSRTTTHVGGGSHAEDALTLSPGLRFAINTPSGLQIVPGIAVPITTQSGVEFADTDKGLFLYLSFEHAFRKR